MNESYWIVEHVAKIGDAFAKERMWKEKGVLWYAFLIERNEINDTDDKLGIFMAEQRKYDLNYNGSATANLTIEIDEISEEVKNGKIKLSVNGYTLDITEFKGCYDVACNDTYNEVKSIKVRGKDSIYSEN
ncbi:hypothetical protein FSP39_023540 [Pinctada imbricata]|uniref:Uncharacterized protein n=1 Tax=Pinctada imbricata TaxID=66713 RepID=A0AA88XFA8_PINIB|nr:hypothetical protein FSP39_023540 [Pinctada imbricata]